MGERWPGRPGEPYAAGGAGPAPGAVPGPLRPPAPPAPPRRRQSARPPLARSANARRCPRGAANGLIDMQIAEYKRAARGGSGAEWTQPGSGAAMAPGRDRPPRSEGCAEPRVDRRVSGGGRGGRGGAGAWPGRGGG